jgi:hypothetical protein
MTEYRADAAPERLDRARSNAVRERQRGRANALGVALFAAAALFFAITVVKTGVW